MPDILTQAGLLVVAATFIVREIFTWLKSRGTDIPLAVCQVNDLHAWLGRENDNGIRVVSQQLELMQSISDTQERIAVAMTEGEQTIETLLERNQETQIRILEGISFKLESIERNFQATGGD